MKNIKISIFLSLFFVFLCNLNGVSQSNPSSTEITKVILQNFPSKTNSKQVDEFILDIKNYKCQSKKIGKGKFEINIPAKLRSEWIKPCPSHVYQGREISFKKGKG